jgi:hypothetical protein
MVRLARLDPDEAEEGLQTRACTTTVTSPSSVLSSGCSLVRAGTERVLLRLQSSVSVYPVGKCTRSVVLCSSEAVVVSVMLASCLRNTAEVRAKRSSLCFILFVCGIQGRLLQCLWASYGFRSSSAGGRSSRAHRYVRAPCHNVTAFYRSNFSASQFLLSAELTGLEGDDGLELMCHKCGLSFDSRRALVVHNEKFCGKSEQLLGGVVKQADSGPTSYMTFQEASQTGAVACHTSMSQD